MGKQQAYKSFFFFVTSSVIIRFMGLRKDIYFAYKKKLSGHDDKIATCFLHKGGAVFSKGWPGLRKGRL